MANTMNLPAMDKINSAQIILPGTTHDLRVVLLDLGAYSYNQSHEFLSAVPLAARVVTQPLTGRTFSGGVFDGNNVTFPGFTGPTVEGAYIYRHVTGDADSPLIFFIDTATGLPLTPDGRPAEIRWSDGPAKIFRYRMP